jgi:hypothetical protein
MKITVFAIALALAGSALNARAQSPGGTPTPGNTPGVGPGRGRAGQHRPASPEKIAEELMKKFDTDKDGELSVTELTQAVEALREHRAQGLGGRASQGGNGTPEPGAAGAQGGNQARPSPEQIAAHMIEKFSSDKKGLTVAELAKAIAERRANHGQHGGQQTGAQTPSPAA